MKKILVVEDEYYARKSIVKILQESDLDIQVCGEAENGMKAIELLEEYKDIALVMAYILFIIVFIASIVQLRFSERNSI